MQIKLNIFIIYRCLRHLFLRLLVFGGRLAGVGFEVLAEGELLREAQFIRHLFEFGSVVRLHLRSVCLHCLLHLHAACPFSNHWSHLQGCSCQRPQAACQEITIHSTSLFVSSNQRSYLSDTTYCADIVRLAIRAKQRVSCAKDATA